MKQYVIIDSDGYVNCVSETQVESDGESSVEMDVPEDIIHRGLSAFRVVDGVCVYDEARAERIRIESIAADVREKRNELLDKTDYLVMSDYPISEEQRAAWAAYRQALRDLPAQEGWPDAVVWPEIPQG